MLYNWQSIKLNPTTTTHKSIIYSVFSDKLSNWQSTHYNYIESQVPAPVPVPMSQLLKYKYQYFSSKYQYQYQVPVPVQVLENGT